MIHPATIKDATAISYIHAASWKVAYQALLPQAYLDQLPYDFWVEAFTNWISTGQMTAKLIYDQQTPVGCIAYCKSRDAALANWGEIVSIYLLPQYLGTGLGKKLMHFALTDLKKQGFSNIYLWVLENNRRAISFYEKSGFIRTDDKIKMDVGGKEITDIRYIYSFDHK
ncbi:GNAT family N-acetyltransferase [Anaerotignum sp.]|uniref:GNAT family N-acetyltransferase n=1 Tax=Anaerotignum sp. TaxID=2039241 RepID=UPI003319C582